MRDILKGIIGFIVVFQFAFFTPTVAKADLVEDILDAAATAGGWPSNLPAPSGLLKLFAKIQDCSEDTSEKGIINCIETLADDPVVMNEIGADTSEKIHLAIDVYVAITESDYITVLSILGETAGCAAAAIITGIPVCAMAQLIADLAGAVIDVVNEVYEFLQTLGAHGKMYPNDFYDIFYGPQVSLGVQILLFTNSYQVTDKYGSLIGPLRSACYDYFRDIDDMSVKNANKTCDSLQNQFNAEVNGEIAKMEASGQKAIGVTYDKNVADDWGPTWRSRCNLPSGSVKNIDEVIKICEDGVATVFGKGREKALGMVKSCLKTDAMVYDTESCAYAGYKKIMGELKDTVAINEKIALDYKNDPNSAPNVWKGIKDQLEMFSKDVGPWIKECNFAQYQGQCNSTLKWAWDTCRIRISKIVWKGDIGPDEKEVQNVKTACEGSYAAIVSTFAKYVKNYFSIYDLTPICPSGEYSNVANFSQAKQACDDHMKTAANNCAGGVPYWSEDYYKNGKIPQSPQATKPNCTSEISFFKEKWGQDEALMTQIKSALSGAKGMCDQLGSKISSECKDEVSDKVEGCEKGIQLRANKLGLLPSAPGFKSDRDKALKDMQDYAGKCATDISVAPNVFSQIKIAEVKVLEQFGSKCPPNEKVGTKWGDKCKENLKEEISECMFPSASKKMSASANAADDAKKEVTLFGKKKKAAKPDDGGGDLVKDPIQKAINACQAKLEGVITDSSKAYTAAQPDISKDKGSMNGGIKAGMAAAAAGAADSTKEDDDKARATRIDSKKRISLPTPSVGIQPADKPRLKSTINMDAPPETNAREGLKATIPTGDARGAVKLNADAVKKLQVGNVPAVRGTEPSAPAERGTVQAPTLNRQLPSINRGALVVDVNTQLRDKGCTPQVGVNGGFVCRDDAALKYCEELKTTGKVRSCTKSGGR